MATRRTRSAQQEPDNEFEVINEVEEPIIPHEEDKEVEEPKPEPAFSDDLIVYRAVEKAKHLDEQKKPSEKGIVSDRERNELKKLNDRIVNKLGLGGTRSYRV